ncbi:MAG TPA: signal peptide peptidase SppA [Nitrospirota bacterium]|nr:signal peptide peptidase SppA [Nitrospirota bacterium]
MKKFYYSAFALILLWILSGCTLLKISLSEEMEPLTERIISGEGKDKILLLDISGFIASEDSSSIFGSKKQPSILALVREQLDRARSDKDVKVLLLRINSPGGGVTASDILYHEIKRFKLDTGIKVLAHIMDMGTSGAYYTALAADRITAQPTSVTGSIGVIMLRLDATGLMQKIGVQAFEISSGERKGMGSPFRQFTPEERNIFQTMVNSLQGRFVNAVATERKLTIDVVKKLADGRIYTSQEAQSNGLIDGISYLDEALNEAKTLANLKRASVVTYFRPGEYRANLYSVNLINIDAGGMVQPGVSLMYLWWP